MAEISRSALFGRLAPSALKSIETAFGFTKLRGNPYVELVHWLHTLNADANGDFAAIKRHFNLDDGALGRDTVAALDGLPRGASSVDLSVQVEEAVEKGWLYASLMFGANKVRSGHLLYGILKTPNLKNVLFGVSNQYRKIDADKLGEGFGSILGSTVEASEGGRLGAGGTAAGGGAPDADGDGEPSGDSALARFSVDLTAKARSGEIDKIVGRDAEIRQCIDILLRRRQNNPILTGEAGVGKTAVVEGFARRIADGDVPPVLRDVTLRSLDIGLLSAGASVKGEFEKSRPAQSRSSCSSTRRIR
jgi:type VI secretion system protein VasG